MTESISNTATSKERAVTTEFNSIFSSADITYTRESLMLMMDRRIFSNILARTELFMKIVSIPGDVVECGVYKMNGFMTFFHLSSILEPYNFNRKIVGFDTFEGFPELDSDFDPKNLGGYLGDVDFDLLNRILKLQESDKLIDHKNRSILVRGNALNTVPAYVREHPSTLISLLYLDFDTYEGTKTALTHLYPLVPKGGIVAFDELAQAKWPGETIALKEVLNVSSLRLERFSFEPHVSYFVKE